MKPPTQTAPDASPPSSPPVSLPPLELEKLRLARPFLKSLMETAKRLHPNDRTMQMRFASTTVSSILTSLCVGYGESPDSTCKLFFGFTTQLHNDLLTAMGSKWPARRLAGGEDAKKSN